MDFIYEKLLAMTAEDCDLLIDLFEKNPLLHTPGVTGNNQLNENIKKSTEVALTPDFLNDQHWGNLIETLLNTLKSGVDEYKDAYSWKENNSTVGINGIAPWRVNFTYNFQRYLPSEGYYNWHCEVPNSSYPCVNRMLTWMIYLNTVSDGGTEFKFQNKIIQAEQGKLIIWPPYWTHYHRGIPSQTSNKYVITGWASFIDGE